MGLDDIGKRQNIFPAKKSNADISCIQKTIYTKTFETTFNDIYKGKIYYGHSDSSHSRGVCIILRRHLEVKINSITKQHNGTII